MNGSQRLSFRVEATATGSRARAARFSTLHNEVLTPTFMPVGTHAAVRAQRREDLLASGAQVLLANTYHLMLRPGTELFEKFGGIHRFMNWPRSVLTDSGGFQIFSLPGSRSISEEGAEFRSYVDQTVLRLSPETSVAAQIAIGADIMMVLDQCVPSTVERTVAAACDGADAPLGADAASRRAANRPRRCSGSCKGASYRGPARRERADHRAAAVRRLRDRRSCGRRERGRTRGLHRRSSPSCCPQDRPRYLMGVGTTRDLLEAVHRGVDMFDCILPTALAKQGVAFTSWAGVTCGAPPTGGWRGPSTRHAPATPAALISIAYLFHLNKVSEALGWQLLGLHNIHFYMQLMRRMREHILAGTWRDFYRGQRDVLDARDSYGAAAAARDEGRAAPSSSSRWGATRSSCATASDTFATGLRARSCTRSTIRPRRRARCTWSSRGSSTGCWSPEARAAGGVGRRSRRGGQCDGGDSRGRGAGGRRAPASRPACGGCSW